jgi:hypothetical protein
MLHVCLFGWCICFTHTLHVFYLDVCVCCNGFQVFQKQVSSVLIAFRCMLQLLYLDISKVDRCYISPHHLLLHHLSRRRQGIIQRRGRVLPNRRRRAPLPSCRSGGAGPGPAWSTKRSVARGRPGASTSIYNVARSPELQRHL